MGYFKCNWNNCLKLLFLLNLGLPDFYTTRFFLNSCLSFILQICWILVRFESVLQWWVDVGGPLGSSFPFRWLYNTISPLTKSKPTSSYVSYATAAALLALGSTWTTIATRILNYATIAGLQNVLSNIVTLRKLTDKPHLNQNI